MQISKIKIQKKKKQRDLTLNIDRIIGIRKQGGFKQERLITEWSL